MSNGYIAGFMLLVISAVYISVNAYYFPYYYPLMNAMKICPYSFRMNGPQSDVHSNYFQNRHNLLIRNMIDRSSASAYLSIGDRVQVINDVNHNFQGQSYSSKGMIGIVSNVWDKCEVDPHCCCAELAFDAPIEVTFNLSDYSLLAQIFTITGIIHSGTWKSNYAINELNKII